VKVDGPAIEGSGAADEVGFDHHLFLSGTWGVLMFCFIFTDSY